MGLAAGLMGMGPEDDAVVHAERLVAEPPHSVRFETRVTPIRGAVHPNTMQIRLSDTDGVEHVLVALSVGGGVIDILSVDAVPVPSAARRGDRHWLCVRFDSAEEAGRCADTMNAGAVKYGWLGACVALPSAELVGVCDGDAQLSGPTVFVDSCSTFDSDQVRSLCPSAKCLTVFPCVMPLCRPPDVRLPFTSAAAMQSWVEPHPARKDMSLGDLAVEYECARGGCSRTEVLATARRLVEIYRGGVESGLKGTEYHDRILPAQCTSYESCRGEAGGRMLKLGLVDDVVACTSAYMEVKSSYGVIVAGPTAGSCGVVPGTLFGALRAGSDPDRAASALMAAGMVGALIATASTFAAEEGGCQAECGAAGAMAAAGLVELQGGSPRQALAAASMTLQSLLGMVCDMVANRVEAPCLYRNVAAASMACSSANMAISGFAAVLPFDEVLAAHWDVSKALPRSLRCTGLGGLAAQPTARRLEEEMKGGCGDCACERRKDGKVALSTAW
eukprot:TRINITY_DN2691_c6_g1_i1.p1 TRINITY_DN2691_c6_g1~~TRINITY_DN2691_c6_g1_i1.p1  ORF type:complete len:584 (+),score=104.07 TRINITY_DN2691_c6_g1_i1:245-1753(+)